ncbi:protein transporter TIM23 [Spizellomyces punctatus DAOM BR117]|uniref:Mitochondrial import inner membrane translocase subunit TIM23 n=1 Tax=Spizellomyces punctatus (strain DAOM BR117) TaxID=645134 RepID=A0A0L0HP65_SPIPD|nr:protein transporter TIM23 [Spizellomyces punctatus DAOM BR117]KND03196.1 hypothetical protein SPPG_02253 [Spizellomyces punctatus DAOM BR117]|eukprot:XP_016611235.1 hypothetical protein SPPG_02253 [Spizellomyces punctatus DAOM BR117]
MPSWFGFGGQQASEPTPTSSTDVSSTATTSDLPHSYPSQSSSMQAITVSDMLADLGSAGPDLNNVKQKLAPVPQDDVELLYLADNPFGLPPTERQTGTFGPLPMRTNYDKLLYGVGTAYLGGLSGGGVYGALRGLRTAQVPTFKVRMNSVLNQTTRYGPWAANSMGILTMGWALLDNAFEMIRGESDYINHISAAFTSGFIFKSTAGLRPAFLTGSILASVVGSYGLWDKLRTDGLRLPTVGRGQPAASA